MKKNKFGLILSIIVAAIVCSCEDNIKMTTVLGKDGSAHREICFRGDEAMMRGDTLGREHLAGVLDNDGWKKEWGRDVEKENGDSVLMCRASRDFESVEEMAKNYPLEIGGREIMKDCRLEKCFRWFTTDYTFTETYVSFSDCFKVPLSRFFDEDALGFWLIGEPNIFDGRSGAEMSSYMEEMNKSFERWLGANIIFEAVGLMAEDYDSLAVAGFRYFTENSREQMLGRRDSLVDFAINRSFSVDDGVIGRLLADFFKDDCFMEIWADGSSLNHKLEERFVLLYRLLFTLNVDYRLAMPGTQVVDCGVGRMEDGAIAYRLTGARLLSNDYTVSATFRSQNLWAYFVTGLIVLLAFLVFARLRRKG